MNTFITKDGTTIYFKDWGTGPVDQPADLIQGTLEMLVLKCPEPDKCIGDYASIDKSFLMSIEGCH